MELFPFTLPKSNICMETELYYRSSKEVLYEEDTGRIVFECDTVLTFDTYFNCFSCQKYAKYTKAKILEVHVKLQGKVRLRLLKAEMDGNQVKRTELLIHDIIHEELQEAVISYDFNSEKGGCFLYLELTAFTKAVFAGGYYATPLGSKDVNNIKVAIVICTYCREHYVRRNLDYFTETIFTRPMQEIGKHLEVFVIDNGKTLKTEVIENEHIKLFANKNYGGSGGFTRGIIESLRRKKEFSHVLLMDDDILFESSVLIKTIRFLQLLQSEHQDVAIGGSMLRLDDMTIQHEAGAKWTGIRILSGNPNIDLRSAVSILQNENIEMPQYIGWWYCCIPLCLIDVNQLPLPFFIKTDDIEYSIRILKKNLIINGIAVWHEPFEKKQVPQLDYYDVRNKLVLNTLYEQKYLTAKNLFLIMRYIGKHLLRGSAEMIAFPIHGGRDYLKGIHFFKTVESDQQHEVILEEYKKILTNRKNSIFYWGIAAKEYFILAIELIYKQKQLKREYNTELKQITSVDYWAEKLEIDGIN